MVLIFQTIEHVLLPFFTLCVALWGGLQLYRRHRPEAAGALAAAGVLGLATSASLTELMLWEEGGWWTMPVAMLGAYAVGSAVAALVAPRAEGPRRAALVALALAAGTGLWAHASSMDDAREAVRQGGFDAHDTELILAGASREAWRPAQLSGVFGVVVAALLLRRRRAMPPTALTNSAAARVR